MKRKRRFDIFYGIIVGLKKIRVKKLGPNKKGSKGSKMIQTLFFWNVFDPRFLDILIFHLNHWQFYS